MSEVKKIRIEAITESEKKSKERSEAERKAEIADSLERKKDKEKLLSRLEKDKGLAFLRSMIERDLIGIKTAEAIVDGKDLDAKEIEEIFEKIDEIESTHDVERILPRDMRISKAEYLAAISDAELRKGSLVKIDRALAYIYETANPHSFSALNFFGGFMAALDKNLVLVQENTIDIKRSLLVLDTQA